jgi:murein DD-endopeptidase MepM/ murein hydrolase activator NlpD
LLAITPRLDTKRYRCSNLIVWSRTIKYTIKQLGKVIIGTISIALLGLVMLLIVEYRFFHDQAQKMLELKEEYRNYTVAVKKILNEYNAIKEQAVPSTPLLSESQTPKESFIIVNREPAYLKESMVNFVRQQNLESLLKRIDPNEWIEYGELIKQTSKKVGLQKKRKKNRIKRAKSLPSFNAATITATKDINFIWPVDRGQFWLSSFFGPRRKLDHSWGFHYGIDMAACRGTPVLCAAPGMVIEAHFHPGYGNTVLISHTSKYKTRYAHLDKINVYVGQKVEQGTLVGKVGSTGAVRKKKGRDASHLHFEVYAHGKQINPLSFFV